MSDIAPTPEEIKDIRMKSVECDSCGHQTMTAKSGVYSDQCPKCGAALDIEWGDDNV